MRDWRIVFDLDDTLFPEREYVQSGFEAVGKWVEKKFGHNGFLDASQKIFQSGERKLVFNQALACCDIPADDALILDLLSVYRSHSPRIRLFPDAAEVLRQLQPNAKGIITDGYLEVQRLKVRALNIADHFSSIVYSDKWGRSGWKPSPVPYEQSMKDLGGAAVDFVYIADNPAKDFVTAKRLGWFTVQVQRANGLYREQPLDASHCADVVISDLTGLLPVLREAPRDVASAAESQRRLG